MQREKKREFPNPEELTALLQKIDAELAIRRTKMDTSRLLGYQIEDLDIRRYICMHVLSYLDIMEKEMVEFWLECIRYDGSYDFSALAAAFAFILVIALVLYILHMLHNLLIPLLHF